MGSASAWSIRCRAAGVGYLADAFDVVVVVIVVGGEGEGKDEAGAGWERGTQGFSRHMVRRPPLMKTSPLDLNFFPILCTLFSHALLA
jgi:hypothetical protein